MAKPAKSSETKVTRIKASDTPRTKKETAPKKASTQPAKKVVQAQKTEKPELKAEKARGEGRKNPLGPLGRYFKGSWEELRQVRWPDRRTTWGMTGALLAFTAFFVVIILLLDAAFAELFNLLLGK